MPKLLKLRYGPFKHESRDEREMQAASEAGFDVILLAMPSSPKDHGKVEQTPTCTTHWFSPPKINWIPFFYLVWRFYAPLLWIKKVRAFHAQVISCHDLPALKMAYFSTLFMRKKKRPKLVYDSHEFELGRNTVRSRFQNWRVLHWERFLMNRCAFSIMVNDSIADEVQRVHQLKTRPLVIRSTPDCWPLDKTLIASRRAEMLQKLGVGEPAFLVMYHGAITTNRGIEQMLEAVRRNPQVRGVILGYSGEDAYMEILQQTAAQPGLAGRVLFLPAVPLEELWQYVGAVDIGCVLIQPAVSSYYLCLPNKLFENIQSLTPVLTSNFPEMKRVVEHYDIGLTCEPNKEEPIDACIEKMRTDKALYAKWKHNLPAAKNDLSWENEKKPLVKAYKELM